MIAGGFIVVGAGIAQADSGQQAQDSNGQDPTGVVQIVGDATSTLAQPVSSLLGGEAGQVLDQQPTAQSQVTTPEPVAPVAPAHESVATTMNASDSSLETAPIEAETTSATLAAGPGPNTGAVVNGDSDQIYETAAASTDQGFDESTDAPHVISAPADGAESPLGGLPVPTDSLPVGVPDLGANGGLPMAAPSGLTQAVPDTLGGDPASAALGLLGAVGGAGAVPLPVPGGATSPVDIGSMTGTDGNPPWDEKPPPVVDVGGATNGSPLAATDSVNALAGGAVPLGGTPLGPTPLGNSPLGSDPTAALGGLTGGSPLNALGSVTGGGSPLDTVGSLTGGGSPLDVLGSVTGGGSPLQMASSLTGGSPLQAASSLTGGSPLETASSLTGGSPLEMAGSLTGGGSPLTQVTSLTAGTPLDQVTGTVTSLQGGGIISKVTMLLGGTPAGQLTGAVGSLQGGGLVSQATGTTGDPLSELAATTPGGDAAMSLSNTPAHAVMAVGDSPVAAVPTADSGNQTAPLSAPAGNGAPGVSAAGATAGSPSAPSYASSMSVTQANDASSAQVGMTGHEPSTAGSNATSPDESSSDDGEPALAASTGSVAATPAGNGGWGSGGHSDVASQQTITAVGGMQQNPCGAQEASLFFVNTTDWGTCATSDGGSAPAGSGGWGSGGHSDVASQQTITAIGGMQQNPCGQQAASLFFVSSHDFGTCATDNGGAAAAPAGAGTVPAGSGWGSGGHSDVASQQTITAVGGMQQNPCGAQAASLFFVNSTDWGTCATSDGGATASTLPASNGGYGSGGHSDVASQQTITAVGGMQQNPCGAQAASLFFVNSTDWGTCATSEGGATTGAVPAGSGGWGSGGHSDVASQQTITAVGGMQQNPCGAQEASLFFVNTTDWGTCATSEGGSVAASGATMPAGTGGWGSGGHSDVASQQTITAVGGMQQNPCGAQEASLFFVNTTDWGTCATSDGGWAPGSTPGTGGSGGWGSGGHSDVASQQTITAVGGMQQNPCGAQEASLFFVNTTDWGTCATSDGGWAPGSTPGTGGSGGWGSGGHSDVASQQTITAIGGMQQNPCGAQEASLFFVNTTDWGTCATSDGPGTSPAPGGTGGWGSGGHTDVASQQTITAIGGMQQNPCGAQVASLFFVNSTDWGTCATSGGSGQPGPIPPPPPPGGDGQLTVGTPTVNGQPAGAAPGPNTPEGAPLAIVVPIQNSGDTPVTGISGSTPDGSMICGSTELAPGESTTCAAATTAGSGAQTVPVQVTGTGPSGSLVSGNGTVYYTGTPAVPPPGGGGALTVGTPTANGQAAGTAPGPEVPDGQQAAIEVPVQNTGDGSVSNLSGATPSGSLTCDSTDLAPGESTTCSIEADPTPGPNVVPVTVTAENEDGTPTAGATVTYFQGDVSPGPGDQPEITVSNPTVNGVAAGTAPGPVVPEGEDAQVEATVTNTGAIDVSGLDANAPQGELTCESTELAPGESTQCSLTADSVAGPQVVPIAVTGEGDGGTPVAGATVANYQGETPGGGDGPELTVGTPTVNGDPAGSTPGPDVPEGEDAQVEVPVTNTGDVDVSGLDGTSPAGDVTCESSELAPGESTTCSLTTESMEGPQSVPVTVSAAGPDGDTTSDNATASYTGSAPGSGGDAEITVGEPTVNGMPAGASPGAQVTSGAPSSVVVAVTNSGDSSMSGVSGQAAGSPLTCADTSLAPGESTTCQVTLEASDGVQVVPIVITAVDSATGEQVSQKRNMFLVGRPGTPGNDPGNDNGNGNDGPGNGDDPSGQQPISAGNDSSNDSGVLPDTPAGGVPAGSGPSATSGHGWLYGAGWVMLFLALGAAYARRRMNSSTEI